MWEQGFMEGAASACSTAAQVSWRGGWGLILLGMTSGAVLGLFFRRPDFLGG